MADIVISTAESVSEDMQVTYEDQGDGTHALVIALEE